ncbi:MAG: lipoate--protein ligase family protein [Bacteroidales bacterium]|nr:lipoate--protein ligase family protein [Bacteroidales bacterium]
MIYIERKQTDPYFNIAAEEYLLKNLDDEILMFWQSTDSVILGKHQNTLKEVDLEYVNTHNIPVIRRISGGGTVFHDLGNINYTLITRGEKQENLVDFKKFTLPVIQFLRQFGLKSQFEGKNNLILAGKKFSGNSAHVFKNRVMHHGTLLYETRLDILENIINPHQAGVQDKSIESIRASVTNISDHLKEKISLESFKKQMTDYFMDYFKIESRQSLSTEIIHEIQKLAHKKYHDWSWNYGYSPKYQFSNELKSTKGLFRVELGVKDGFITEIKLLHNGVRLEIIENKILGTIHEKSILLDKIGRDDNAGIIVEVLFPKTGPNKIPV